MFARSVFVTGCSRGLGLEWVRQLAPKTKHLFAGCRSQNPPQELQAVADEFKNVEILHVDLTCEDSIKKSIQVISENVGDEGLNCLINNAGVAYHINSFDELTEEVVTKTHQVNVVGTINVIKACLPLLKMAATKQPATPMGVQRASIVNITSDFASLNLMTSAKDICYEYRLSQASLNMLTRMLAAEYKEAGLFLVSIHPGHVQTVMGGADGSVSPTQSIRGMMETITSLKENDSGCYVAYDGSNMPW